MIGFALDMDGTLYKGENPIPGAKEFVAELERRGIPYRYLTNNSSHPCSFFAARLRRLGFDEDGRNVLSSTVATARFIKAEREGAKVYAIATPEVEAELESLGVDLVGEEEADTVLLTFDTTVDYRKLNAGYHLMLRGAELVATHPDDLCPTESSYDVDIGPFIRLFESLTGAKATVVGKPSRRMLEMAGAEMGIDPSDVVMVGDRLSTDIRMGMDAGTRTVLVMSGETDRAMLDASDVRPTYVVDSVADIIPELVDGGRLRGSRVPFVDDPRGLLLAARQKALLDDLDERRESQPALDLGRDAFGEVHEVGLPPGLDV